MSDEVYSKLTIALKREAQIGQIFWVPSPMTVDSTYTLRVGSWKAGRDIAEARLTVERARVSTLGKHSAQDRVNMGRMVLPEINLDSSEDLVVNKVKIRPAVLIYRHCYNLRKFSAGTSKDPNRYVFAPVYSLRKDDEGSKPFPEAFINNVQQGDYPNICYLPAYGVAMKNDSMMVLSEMFSVAKHAVEPTDYCINPNYLLPALDTFNEFIFNEAAELNEALQAPPV